MRKSALFLCSLALWAWISSSNQAWLTSSRENAQINKDTTNKSLAEIYKTGKIKFVPELIISDENFGGKDFFGYPNDVAVDVKNDIYVCDNREHNIKKFSVSGEYIKTFGKLGQGPGDLNTPMEIECFDGRLYVRDLMNKRMSIFDSQGAFIRSLKLPPDNIIWHSIRILPDGRFIAHLEKRFYVSPTPPTEITLVIFSQDFSSSKSLFERNISNGHYILNPRRVFVPNPFGPDLSWDLSPERKIVIGYSEKYEILILDPNNDKTDSFAHKYVPVAVGEKDKDAFFREMRFLSGSSSGGATTQVQGAPEYIVKNTEFPKTYPPFRNIKVDSEGNIWVRPYKTNDVSYDIFSKEGKFINQIRLVGETKYPWLTTRTSRGFWIISEKEDLYILTKVRIESAK
ncbi:MAG: 6-bladed beta-propeller [Candidatus Aminicenantes bacterium]|nr:6-bladed beta-propeller [Candidatus Aminicenantes bacterium]